MQGMPPTANESTRRIASGVVVACVVICLTPTLSIAAEDDKEYRLGDIDIQANPIFTDEERTERRLFRLIDRFHVTTREETIRRVLWKQPGDRVTRKDVAEMERNVRDLGVFNSVKIHSTPNPENPDVLDIGITTRDRVSLLPVVIPFSVGGIDGFGAVLIENNLFGTADRLSLRTSRNSESERETRITYTDRYVGRSQIRFDIDARSTEEGEAFGVSLKNPFTHLQDDRSWKISLRDAEDRIDYFEAGDSVVEVPSEATTAGVSYARAYGDVANRSSVGVSLTYENNLYSTPIGPQADTIQIPGELTKTTFGMFHTLRRNTRFVIEENFDRIGVDEDLELGFQLNTVLSATDREEQGANSRTEPGASLDMTWAGQFGKRTYLTTQLSAFARYASGDRRAWHNKGEIHLFRKTGTRGLFAANLNYEEQQELDELPPQMTLGEDNGLRGYPSRQFTGRKRARINIEHRTDLDREVFTFKLGGVVFADAGWIGDDSLGSARTSVGIGLRMASPQITGGRVLRLDIAHPLNEKPGEDFGTTVSFAFGQVFDFFGSNQTLSNR